MAKPEMKNLDTPDETSEFPFIARPTNALPLPIDTRLPPAARTFR